MGAVFAQYASWRWVFWFLAMMTFPIVVVGLIFIPPQSVSISQPKWVKFKSLDLVGVALLTGGLNTIFYTSIVLKTLRYSRVNLIHFLIDIGLY